MAHFPMKGLYLKISHVSCFLDFGTLLLSKTFNKLVRLIPKYMVTLIHKMIFLKILFISLLFHYSTLLSYNIFQKIVQCFSRHLVGYFWVHKWGKIAHLSIKRLYALSAYSTLSSSEIPKNLSSRSHNMQLNCFGPKIGVK